ncbi:MAG: hypothetical protein LJE69_17805 [Thiohalocapsa sp.]|uniref:hypothetical protein n=1 Tax=Thiohalocapsa sp. TaxID=2497641 RepID=UPI0025CC007C|nr:hypothetical protein [Thiohalocapsa sp.]MCG6943089.1 hypothetical protein [Thiohalocapsa sp.]
MKQRALDDPNLAPFTRSVLAKIEPAVLASLTEHQFRCIRDAVDQTRPISRHSIDVRGNLPLLFARYYFVFLAGRDRRTNTRYEEKRLWKRLASAAGALLLGTAVLVPVVVFLLLVGYAIKTFLGVDLYPDTHLLDMVR